MLQPTPMYGEEMVREIMVSTALCIQEMLLDDPGARQDDLIEFVENSFRQIIRETLLAEGERRKKGFRDSAAD